MFKGGTSPSLSVDRIGGDRATTSTITPRSTRVNSSSGENDGCLGLGSDSCGGHGEDADGIGQSLTPLDLSVGQQVLLMKRPMVVCGWDEAAHVWWEKMTGESGRGTPGRRHGVGDETARTKPLCPPSVVFDLSPQRPLRKRGLTKQGNRDRFLRKGS